MQSQDENGNNVLTQQVSPENIADVMQMANKLGAVQHTIGNLPNRGDTIKLGGLVFEVKFVDYKRGEVRIKVLENFKTLPDGSIMKINKKSLG